MKHAIAPWMIPKKPARDRPAQIPLELPIGPPPGYYDERKPSPLRREVEDDESDRNDRNDRYIVDIGGNDGNDDVLNT